MDGKPSISLDTYHGMVTYVVLIERETILWLYFLLAVCVVIVCRVGWVFFYLFLK